MHDIMENLVARKRERFESKGAVYTGRMVKGDWVPSSLHDARPEFGAVLKLPEMQEGELPEEMHGGFEFIGGTSNRAFYANMDVLKSHEKLWAWWQEKGDSHLLASMFLRPGKLCVDAGWTLSLPEAREDGSDGVLMRLAKADWARFVKAYELPWCTGAQVTIFRPEGVIAKGFIRLCLEGEEPALCHESWKWLDGVAELDARSMAVLTVDSVYSPRPSVNGQEHTYAKARGAKLAAWVLEETGEYLDEVAASVRQSPDTPFGYLMSLGFPAPDKLLAEAVEGQRGSIMKCLRRYPVQSGWRGKATASPRVAEGELLLPVGLRGKVQQGDTVWVTRNPNLPSTGPVRYRVAGFVRGNLCYFNATDTQWQAVLGGDFDGDDAVVLFKPPFDGDVYEYPGLDVQQWKSSSRSLSASTLEERLARWNQEVSTPIGIPDMIARYAVDLGMATPALLETASETIQFFISLKKRMGSFDMPEALEKLARQVGGLKELTPTYLLSKYEELSLEHRDSILSVADTATVRIVEMVQSALAATELPRPRFTLKPVEDFLASQHPHQKYIDVADETMGKLLTLGVQKLAAMEAGDEDMILVLNREVKMLTQVEVPEYMLGLPVKAATEFAAALYQRAPRTNLWLYAVPMAVWVARLKQVYAKENPCLFSKDGHNLKVGDVLTLKAHSRSVTVDGTVLHYNGGILWVGEDKRVRVVKAYAKSVVVEDA